MRPRVFLVQRPTFKNPVTGQWEDKYNLSPAATFGDIIEIFKPGNLRPDSDNIMQNLLTRMRDFSEQDYLLALGDPIAIAAAACIAVDITDGVVHMLKWDGRKQEYFPVRIDLRYGGEDPGIYNV